MTNNSKTVAIFAFSAFLIALIVALVQFGRGWWYPVVLKFIGKRSVVDVINVYGQEARDILRPAFHKVGLSYPPKKLALLAYKDSNSLEVWAQDESTEYELVTQFPIQAASGYLGPKLREGDRQVPEGVYKIIGFNPNSAYHLSLKLNYPNSFDLMQARQEGRDNPGSNIFIHGKAVSIGCLAMGDPVIEQLFSLIYDVGRDNTVVLIAPTNPAVNNLEKPDGAPDWTTDLYRQIMEEYKLINHEFVES